MFVMYLIIHFTVTIYQKKNVSHKMNFMNPFHSLS